MKRTYQKPELQVQRVVMHMRLLNASKSFQMQYNPDKFVDDDIDAL